MLANQYTNSVIYTRGHRAGRKLWYGISWLTGQLWPSAGKRRRRRWWWCRIIVLLGSKKSPTRVERQRLTFYVRDQNLNWLILGKHQLLSFRYLLRQQIPDTQLTEWNIKSWPLISSNLFLLSSLLWRGWRWWPLFFSSFFPLSPLPPWSKRGIFFPLPSLRIHYGLVTSSLLLLISCQLQDIHFLLIASFLRLVSGLDFMAGGAV